MSGILPKEIAHSSDSQLLSAPVFTSLCYNREGDGKERKVRRTKGRTIWSTIKDNERKSDRCYGEGPELNWASSSPQCLKQTMLSTI